MNDMMRQAILLECPGAYSHQSRWENKVEMPFAALGTAIATVGAGLFGVGITAAGGVGMAAFVGAAATIVGYVGVALGVVGAITGNDTLTKIGMYMGLAGGITAIGAGIAGAGTAAATGAATASTTEAATTAAATAAPQTVQLTAPAGAQAGQAATQGFTQNAASEALNTGGIINSQQVANQAGQALPTLTPTPQTLATTGVGQLAKTAEAPTSSFFQNLLQNPLAVIEIGRLGAAGLGGLYQGEVQQQAFDLQRNELEFNQAQIRRQNKNANTQGRGILSTRPLTPAERAFAEEQARKKTDMRKFLPAGSAS